MYSKLISKSVKNLADKQLPLRLRLWNETTLDLGPAPCVSIRLNNPKASLCFLKPTMDRLGQAYVEGQIDVEGDIYDIIKIAEKLGKSTNRRRSPDLIDFIGLRHTKSRDSRAVRYHYDVSNEFYALWLDRNMVYSCAYFRSGDEDIDRAQEQKLDHICRKLRLSPEDNFLDIGCGWGGLICWAAKNYGAKATGITLSKNQYEYVKERIEREKLTGRVEVLLTDYRDMDGQEMFDKIASVGMFEHVGVRKLPVYFGAIRRLLKEGGLVLNHGITTRDIDSDKISPGAVKFIDTYVFPDGELPHLAATAMEMERQDLEILDIECLRPHYAYTLKRWVSRLEEQRLKAIEIVGEKVYRIWRIYMAGFAHAFMNGWVSVYQILASKSALPGFARHPLTREYQYYHFENNKKSVEFGQQT